MAKPKPEARFMGAFLMAVGFMIAGLCGTCTLVYGVTMLLDLRQASEGGYMPVMLMAMLFVGVLPGAIGVLLLRAGYGLYRGPKARGPGST